ncbi:uncharacterized protein LOC124420222 [Lucilia cuprina]|uniref:uncharacterized protein LOC124420222 n=1 Tax=Lucilia cuprina TaxID=7375 RepID=UPI001F0632F3|nr:uncharacterized protein LOC124420222 [Lucilia cuprina]
MMLLDNKLVFECNRVSSQSLANYQSKLYFSKNSLEEKKISNTTKINFRQKQILAEFMSEHTDLAKGVLPNTSQGKATANRLWENLALMLNASGPPLKDAKTWRKLFESRFHYPYLALYFQQEFAGHSRN